MCVPVSTPARSASTWKSSSGSSWSARSTSTTSPGATRISVWSWRWRIGSVRRSPKRASRRFRRLRSIALDVLRHVGADRPLVPVAALLLDQLLELHHPVDEALGPGRAAGDVDVHGHHAVDALDRAVGALVASARARAVAHRDAPLGLRHLLPQADERPGHLGRQRAGHDEDVRLARAGAEREHAPAVHVVLGRRRGHHLDRAAGEAREERPQAVHPDEVEDVVSLGRDDVERAPARGVREHEVRALELREVEVLAGAPTGVCLRCRGGPQRVGHDDRLRDVARLGRDEGRGLLAWLVGPDWLDRAGTAGRQRHESTPLRHAYARPNSRMPTNSSMVTNSPPIAAVLALAKIRAHRKMKMTSMSNATNIS